MAAQDRIGLRGAASSGQRFSNLRGREVVLFKDVDVSIVVEKTVNGVPVPLPYVVRKADQKTLGQIYQEIESAKSESVTSEGEYVLGVGR